MGVWVSGSEWVEGCVGEWEVSGWKVAWVSGSEWVEGCVGEWGVSGWKVAWVSGECVGVTSLH